MKTIKNITTLLMCVAALGCSKDDPVGIKPDPVQEQPVPEEPAPMTSVGSISPESGPKETPVTIMGTHFGTDITKVQVFFNDEEADVQMVTDSEIVANVPIKAGTGLVKILIDGAELIGPEFEYLFTATVSTFAGSDKGNTGGVGQEALFNNPQGIVRDKEGNLYIADTYNHCIKRITPGGLVTIFAGSKKGDVDGTLTEAMFNSPIGIAIDEKDNIYVADSDNQKIRKITSFGVVVTLAGNSLEGYQDGPGNIAEFNYPVDVDVDSEGNVFVADYYNNKIRKITPEGLVSTLAGSSEGFANGPALEAKFHWPTSVSVGTAGEFYVTDEENYKIRKITKEGNVITLAGSTVGFADGTGEAAQFSYIETVEMAFDGNIWVTDGGNDRIRRITPEGVVTTIAGSTRGFLDGVGTSALFNNPSDMAIANDGTLYIVDRRNHRIRKITQE